MAAGENVATIVTLVTILFSVVVLGWALLYKCSDATMNPSDFSLHKCLGFLIPAETTKTKTTTTKTEITVPDQQLMSASVYEVVQNEENDDDEYYDTMKQFVEMNTKIIGNDYTDIAARSLGECANICFYNEVTVGANSEECGGFVSEYKDVTSDQDRVTCRLYPKGSLSDSKIPSYITRSFYRKGETLRVIE